MDRAVRLDKADLEGSNLEYVEVLETRVSTGAGFE
jgi:hypothetical protein